MPSRLQSTISAAHDWLHRRCRPTYKTLTDEELRSVFVESGFSETLPAPPPAPAPSGAGAPPVAGPGPAPDPVPVAVPPPSQSPVAPTPAAPGPGTPCPVTPFTVNAAWLTAQQYRGWLAGRAIEALGRTQGLPPQDVQLALNALLELQRFDAAIGTGAPSP